MSDESPRTVRELYIYVKGEFEVLNNKLSLVFWIGGLSGTIFSLLAVGFLKLVGVIK